MTVYLRRFKAMDIVVAQNETQASNVDWSDACDAAELVEVREITAEEFARMHESWREHVPAGDDDCRTLGEIFAAGG